MPVINVLPFIPSDPNYAFNTTLNGEQYFFDVRWNTRDEAWYFDLSDATGTAIVKGVKIVLGTFLGRQCPHPFFDENVFAVIDTTLDNLDPTFDDLGVRVLVQHYTIVALEHELAL
jgi:hypothetical protein